MPGAVALPMPPVPPAPGAASKDDESWPAADAAAAGGGDGVVDDNLLHVEVIQGPLDEAQSCDFVVRVKVPRASGSSGRPGADIVCAVDVSGSMQMAATYEDGDGNTQDDGLSMLDIVKHALRTIVATLTPNDRFSIVSFSSSARVVLPLTAMDDDGTSLAESKIQHLNASGQTNLWDGMFKSMNAFLDGAANGEDVHSGRTKAMLVLTDGQPNVVPPRGHLAAMDDFLDKHPELKFQVSACVALSAAGVRLTCSPCVRLIPPPLSPPPLLPRSAQHVRVWLQPRLPAASQSRTAMQRHIFLHPRRPHRRHRVRPLCRQRARDLRAELQRHFNPRQVRGHLRYRRC